MTLAHVDDSVSQSIAATPLSGKPSSDNTRSRPLLYFDCSGDTCQMSTKVHLLRASVPMHNGNVDTGKAVLCVLQLGSVCASVLWSSGRCEG